MALKFQLRYNLTTGCLSTLARLGSDFGVAISPTMSSRTYYREHGSSNFPLNNRCTDKTNA
eukprot:5237466-Amphidinium_carterae.1